MTHAAAGEESYSECIRKHCLCLRRRAACWREKAGFPFCQESPADDEMTQGRGEQRPPWCHLRVWPFSQAPVNHSQLPTPWAPCVTLTIAQELQRLTTEGEITIQKRRQLPVGSDLFPRLGRMNAWPLTGYLQNPHPQIRPKNTSWVWLDFKTQSSENPRKLKVPETRTLSALKQSLRNQVHLHSSQPQITEE